MMEKNEHDVAQAATAVLAQSSVRELRQLRVDEHANTLELSGNVRSFYHKQLAQEAVARIPGMTRLVNEAEVVAPLA